MTLYGSILSFETPYEASNGTASNYSYAVLYDSGKVVQNESRHTNVSSQATIVVNNTTGKEILFNGGRMSDNSVMSIMVCYYVLSFI
jgi:hypothetical protein